MCQKRVTLLNTAFLSPWLVLLMCIKYEDIIYTQLRHKMEKRMITNNPKQRVNIMLDEEQRVFLNRLARERQMSMSEIIREMIDESRRRSQERKLMRIAEELAHSYQTDAELTAFQSLDGEDVV